MPVTGMVKRADDPHSSICLSYQLRAEFSFHSSLWAPVLGGYWNFKVKTSEMGHWAYSPPDLLCDFYAFQWIRWIFFTAPPTEMQPFRNWTNNHGEKGPFTSYLLVMNVDESQKECNSLLNIWRHLRSFDDSEAMVNTFRRGNSSKACVRGKASCALSLAPAHQSRFSDTNSFLLKQHDIIRATQRMKPNRRTSWANSPFSASSCGSSKSYRRQIRVWLTMTNDVWIGGESN